MRPVRAPDLRSWKREGKKIAMLTAYDAAMARLHEKAGIDALLVGDSLGMVVQGHPTTIPVTIDHIAYHTANVVRAVSRPLVIADMPFLTYQTGVGDALRNAGRLVQESGAGAVKLEGGSPETCATVKRIVDAGIPVMGHVGLTPQFFHQLGGFRKQAKDDASADLLLEHARGLEAAGAFSIVLESIPHDVAARVTEALEIPTIGIGAGPSCDGQVLVSHDVLGLADYSPPFAKVYAKVGDQMVQAFEAYAEEVRSSNFPPKDET